MKEQDLEDISRGFNRDMSPEAIGRRLKIVANLRRLSHTLSQAREAAKKKDIEQPRSPDDSPEN
jgi:hypothetical protein